MPPESGRDFGVDWVDVSVEPHHVEQFRTHGVRVYEVTIPPGTATQYHRHDRDTTYVITAGGRFRSREPGRQRSRTTLGRSTPLHRQLRLLISRLRHDYFEMPTGTVIFQPHRTMPLVHQVTADPANRGPIRMIGVELQTGEYAPVRLPATTGLRTEHGSARWPVYRLRLPAGGRKTLAVPGGGVLVVVAGSVAYGRSADPITAGLARWIPSGTYAFKADTEPVDAVLAPT